VPAVRLALAVFVLALSFSVRAAADTCNRPDLLDAVPPDGAENVPPNASLHARYATTAQYLNEDVVVEHVGHDEHTYVGTFDEAIGWLTVTPDPALVPGDQYIVHWPKLRGLNTANLGRAKDVTITAGSTSDEELPDFAGLSSLEWDVDRDRDDCTDSLEERYLFDFYLRPANDDGGRESLMLLVFQTKGPRISSDAPEPVLFRKMPGSGGYARLRSPIADGEGDVCFAAIARDLTDKTSASGNREVCTTTVKPPFFTGCTLANRERSGSAGFGFLIAIACLARWRRRGVRQ
jgi:hypothetical protein